jgi:hypothetical protein
VRAACHAKQAASGRKKQQPLRVSAPPVSGVGARVQCTVRPWLRSVLFYTRLLQGGHDFCVKRGSESERESEIVSRRFCSRLSECILL